MSAHIHVYSPWPPKFLARQAPIEPGCRIEFKQLGFKEFACLGRSKSVCRGDLKKIHVWMDAFTQKIRPSSAVNRFVPCYLRALCNRCPCQSQVLPSFHPIALTWRSPPASIICTCIHPQHFSPLAIRHADKQTPGGGRKKKPPPDHPSILKAIRLVGEKRAGNLLNSLFFFAGKRNAPNSSLYSIVLQRRTSHLLWNLWILFWNEKRRVKDPVQCTRTYIPTFRLQKTPPRCSSEHLLLSTLFVVRTRPTDQPQVILAFRKLPHLHPPR